MTKLPEQVRSVRHRFLEQNYSDCQLLTIRTERGQGGEGERLHLDLLLLSGENADLWVPATLTFIDLGWLKTDIDFWSKQGCSDTLEEGTCEFDSNAISAALAQHPRRTKTQDVTNFLVFTLRLCSPAGGLEVFARDFILRQEVTLHAG
jgi:hypothetical protein